MPKHLTDDSIKLQLNSNILSINNLDDNSVIAQVSLPIIANDSSGQDLDQADKLKVARLFNIGDTGKAFDGTGDVTWTLNEIGAADKDHGHEEYLQLSGGAMTGKLGAWEGLGVATKPYQWIGGKEVGNAAIGVGTQQSWDSYHPILGVMTADGHTVNIGGIDDRVGFYVFNRDRIVNGVDSEFSIHAGNNTIYTTMDFHSDKSINTESTIYAAGDIATSSAFSAGSVSTQLVRITNSLGSENNLITGGNGDNASWDTHNLVIKSHWGIGFRDYQDQCRIVMDTRTGQISTQGDLYTLGTFRSETGLYTNGTITAANNITTNADMVVNGRAWIYDATLSGKFIGEHKFSIDGGWWDPWEGVGCAIKTYGNIATNGTVKGGYANFALGELNGSPEIYSAHLRIATQHDGNGQGDGLTHLGYNNGDGYHHFFRGTGAMHVNMGQSLHIGHNYFYLGGTPLCISQWAPDIGGVWIQI